MMRAEHGIVGRLDGMVAIVTGGAGAGMGSASCRKLASHGAAVVVTDVDDDRGERLVEELTARGSRAIYQHVDVSQPREHLTAVEVAVDIFGSLDILHNHAIGRSMDENIAPGALWPYIHEISPERWDTETRNILSSVFYGIRAAIPAMLEAGGGSIINTSSAAAYGGLRGNAPYSCSKAAVSVLTYCVANEYGASNIRCNAVVPAITGVNGILGLGVSGYDTMEEFTRQQPIERVVDSDEVANLVAFLASNEASAITGAVIPADGGYRAGFGNRMGLDQYRKLR